MTLCRCSVKNIFLERDSFGITLSSDFEEVIVGVIIADSGVECNFAFKGEVAFFLLVPSVSALGGSISCIFICSKAGLFRALALEGVSGVALGERIGCYIIGNDVRTGNARNRVCGRIRVGVLDVERLTGFSICSVDIPDVKRDVGSAVCYSDIRCCRAVIEAYAALEREGVSFLVVLQRVVISASLNQSVTCFGRTVCTADSVGVSCGIGICRGCNDESILRCSERSYRFNRIGTSDSEYQLVLISSELESFAAF